MNNDILLNQSQRIGYFVTLFSVIFGLTFGVAYVVVVLSVNYQANDEIQRYGTSLIRNFDALLNSGEDALDKIEQQSMVDCSADTVYQLKLLRFQHYVIQDAMVLMPNGHDVCSSMEVVNKDSLRLIPSHLKLNGFRYWFNQTEIREIPSERYMVMEKGNTRIKMHLNMIFDSYVIEQPYLVIRFSSQSHVIATTELEPSASPLSTQESWRSQLFTSSKRVPFSVVVARPEHHIQKNITATFKNITEWITLLALILCLLTYCLIRKHRSLFKVALNNGIERGEFIPYF